MFIEKKLNWGSVSAAREKFAFRLGSFLCLLHTSMPFPAVPRRVLCIVVLKFPAGLLILLLS